MKKLVLVVVVALGGLGQAERIGAQEVRGFAAAGVMGDLNDQHFPAFGGGVLLDLPMPWLSAGAQGELFVSWPYVAGRGAVFGQVNVLGRRRVRPFVLAGGGFGESAGPMVGGGVEVRLANRLAFRATVEDYFARVQGFDCGYLGYTQSYCDASLHAGRDYTAHQVAVRFGLVF